MIATTPQSSWALIVSALAELGAREIERREQAQQNAAQNQHDNEQPQTAEVILAHDDGE